jgi:divalent metal cation (Fe/Co/Zn/Cd) transporter
VADSVTTPNSQGAGFSRDERELRAARFAMRMSLAVGIVMLLGKSVAYYMTGSAAILSDFAESVVHVIAVAFAAFRRLRHSFTDSSASHFSPPDLKAP